MILEVTAGEGAPGKDQFLQSLRKDPEVRYTLALRDSYRNTLGRAPDAEGLQIYREQMQGGRSPQSIQVELLQSEESRERIRRLEQEQGREAAIGALYQSVFEREVDEGGREAYIENIQKSVDEVLNELVGSEEHRERQQDGETRWQLSELYFNILGRAPDEEGEKIYLRQLREGRTVEEIQAELENSDEGRNAREAREERQRRADKRDKAQKSDKIPAQSGEQEAQERKRRLLGPIQSGQTFIHPRYGEIEITEVSGSEGQQLVTFNTPRQKNLRRPLGEVTNMLLKDDYLPTKYHSDTDAIIVERIEDGMVVYRVEGRGARREPYRDPIEAFRNNVENRGWIVGPRPGQQDKKGWIRRLRG